MRWVPRPIGLYARERPQGGDAACPVAGRWERGVVVTVEDLEKGRRCSCGPSTRLAKKASHRRCCIAAPVCPNRAAEVQGRCRLSDTHGQWEMRKHPKRNSAGRAAGGRRGRVARGRLIAGTCPSPTEDVSTQSRVETTVRTRSSARLPAKSVA
jgi:hypothetical protein